MNSVVKLWKDVSGHHVTVLQLHNIYECREPITIKDSFIDMIRNKTYQLISKKK